jgi:hypothetical protein
VAVLSEVTQEFAKDKFDGSVLGVVSLVVLFAVGVVGVVLVSKLIKFMLFEGLHLLFHLKAVTCIFPIVAFLFDVAMMFLLGFTIMFGIRQVIGLVNGDPTLDSDGLWLARFV